MYKFLVCMWYDEEIKEYADIFRKINEKYCNENGYDFFYCNKKYTDKPVSFNKIFMFKELLNNNQYYDYYLWIDADAHINRIDLRLETFIKHNEDKDFIWSGDITPNINSGIFFIKNTEFSKLFLSVWCAETKTQNEDWWEQGVLTLMWVADTMDIKKHSHCYRYGVLQSFTSHWDNFIFHMAGTNKNDRIKYAHSIKV